MQLNKMILTYLFNYVPKCVYVSLTHDIHVKLLVC